MLWVQLADCRQQNFCSPILQVASLESTRTYQNLVETKVKDTSQASTFSIFGHVTLTFDLGHFAWAFTTICRRPGSVKTRWTVLEIPYRAERDFCDLVLWPPKPQSWQFYACALCTTCANLHWDQFICFENIVFAIQITDKWTGGQTDASNTHT